MNDFDDLEDLETCLYNQVYHGISEEPVNTPEIQPTNPPQQIQPMGKQCGRYFGPWSPTSRFQNKGGSPKQFNPRASNRRDLNKSDGIYSKNSGTPRKTPEMSIDQVVVVSPKNPIIYMTSKERNRAQRKARLKVKRKQKRAMKEAMMKEMSAIQEIENNHIVNSQSSVITLSDSDDDSCVLVDNNWPVLSVNDSDDESKNTSKSSVLEEVEKSDITSKNEPGLDLGLNESLTDDVIFIEPEVTPIVIINLDDDLENNDKKNKTKNIISKKEKNVKQIHQERKELLNTPDSASNDFMNSLGVELDKRFNFSLHGSDFRSGDFLKPAPRNETCETESSSSTTEANSMNLLQTAVFNEIDFPRDDIFCENNLETFGNFITPLRTSGNLKSVQSSPIVTEQSKSDSVSDISSESDLDENEERVAKKIRSLPELSPMQSQNDIVSQAGKKAKKRNISSKFDLIGDVSLPQKTKQKEAKKKKKNKKKKNIDDDETITGIIPTDSESVKIDDEIKSKKRRSSPIEDSETIVSKKRSSETVSAVTKEQDSVDPEDKNVEIKDAPKNQNIIELNSSEEKSREKSAERKGQIIEVETEEDINNKIENLFTEEGANFKFKFRDENPQLQGFNIVDETFDATVTSDCESVLSALHDPSDIQLNFSDSKTEQKVASAETSTSKLDLHNNSVIEIQQTMSNDLNLWEIMDSDRYPSGKSKGRRCNRCKQFGHMAIRCRSKVEIKCALCGGRGHYEPRCPNKICTQCGQHSAYSTTYCRFCFKLRNSRCGICSMIGHLSNKCPDLWRRYHLTTEEGPVKTYNGPLIEDAQWCSGCAQPGHLEHSCRFHRSVYPPTDPFIKSTEDIYDKQPLLPTPPVPLMNVQLDNQIYQSFDDNTQPSGNDYNSNNFPQMNQQQFVNPLVGNVFVANQQNFVAANLIQQIQNYSGIQNVQNNYSGSRNVQNNYPANQHYSRHQNVQNNFTTNGPVFQNVLPNFIALDSGAPVHRSFKSARPIQIKEHSNKKANSMFFSSTSEQLQHFIKIELQRLPVIALQLDKHIRELKKGPFPPRTTSEGLICYEKINMLLFGVLNLINGKTHLERLKRFRMERIRSSVDSNTRRQLHISYNYIFGRSRNHDVNYHELLRTI